MTRYLAILLLPLLAGCLGLGMQQMTPEQIRATNGMSICTRLENGLSRGVQTSANQDDTRKGATSQNDVVISGVDCSITIKARTGVEPPVTTTTTTVTTVKPAAP